MCDALKFNHVHCSVRLPSGRICKNASSQDPCQLCIWRGRDQDPEPEPEKPKGQQTLF